MPSETEVEPDAKLNRHQTRVIILLLIGYAGYYLCRSNFSVATPLLISEFKANGLNKEAIGNIASMAILLYAIGKFFNGTLTDLFGGRRMFLFGMGGSVLFTVLFALGGLPFFTVVWSLNRIVQSSGWAGAVKVCAGWFERNRYGTVMGVVSLSYLFGDFASRQFLGRLVENGVGWRGLFLISAGVLGVLWVIEFIWLRNGPTEVGLPALPAEKESTHSVEAQKMSAKDLILPLLRNPIFIVVCILSLGITVVRETFGNWTPLYLTDAVHMTKGSAGTASSYFPLFGGISVVLAGWAGDRIGKNGRAVIILGGMSLCLPALLVLGSHGFRPTPLVAIALLSSIAFVILGPYSFLAGSLAMDFGGARRSATACGLIDGFGYLGGVLAGKGIGNLVDNHGWSTAFLFLSGIVVLTIVAAIVYVVQIRRSSTIVIT